MESSRIDIRQIVRCKNWNTKTPQIMQPGRTRDDNRQTVNNHNEQHPSRNKGSLLQNE